MDEMNDVNDFMDKFGGDFEIKWGLALDPTLGDKVKVTILATGFGIEAVDGMASHRSAHQTQEDLAKQAAEEELRAVRRERMEHYYGQSDSNAQYKNRPQIYLFNSEDLDNEDIIMQVENTPTCKRTRQQLEELRRLSHGTKNVGEEQEAVADTSSAPGVIRFE